MSFLSYPRTVLSSAPVSSEDHVPTAPCVWFATQAGSLRRGSDPRGIERSLHITSVWEVEEMNAEVVVITPRHHKSAK